MWQPFFSDQIPSHDHDLTSFDLSTSRIVSIIILIILCRHVAYQLKTAVLHWKCNADVSSFHLICKMPIFKRFWIFQFFELGIWLQGQTRSRTLKRCQIRKIIGQNRGSWTSMWALSNENCGLSPPPPPPKSSSQLQKAPESNSTNLSVVRSTVKEQFAKNHPVQWGPWSCQGAWRLWYHNRWIRESREAPIIELD